MLFSQADEFKVIDLGRVGYEQAEQKMIDLVAISVEAGAPDHLLICEFEPLLTVGRAADVAAYQNSGLPVHEVTRGGKATFHGPGQLVVYPILHLEQSARDLHRYLHALEQALIHAVAEFGLTGTRDERNTGCWINSCKVASIGVAVRRWVTYHGIALNVSTDLSWFQRFDPCGLAPELMTSMQAQLGYAPDFADVKKQVIHHLCQVLRNDS
ncbi:MAG: lipoyl(octanoyl) transferase LipB [Planctomycetes bacterium]|nr:lipoyl(octanoyl) transferase LipB [Planctomycetota bacterium]